MKFESNDVPVKAKFLWAPQMHNVMQQLTGTVIPMTKPAEITRTNPVDYIVIGLGSFPERKALLIREKKRREKSQRRYWAGTCFEANMQICMHSVASSSDLLIWPDRVSQKYDPVQRISWKFCGFSGTRCFDLMRRGSGNTFRSHYAAHFLIFLLFLFLL